MSCIDLKFISSKECMGNSLSSINGNFAALSSAVCDLSAAASSFNPILSAKDSPTIDLSWDASTRTLSADTNISSLTTSITGSLSSSPMVAKAWVKFNGTTVSPTILGSYNISSLTKVSTGIYTVTFVNRFNNNNYVVLGNGFYDGSFMRWVQVDSTVTPTTTSCRINVVKNTVGYEDNSINQVAFFGN